MENTQLVQQDAYKTLTSVYLNDEGNPIHPSELILSGAYQARNDALARFMDNVDLPKIEAFFNEIPSFENELSVFPQGQKDFYLELL